MRTHTGRSRSASTGNLTKENKKMDALAPEVVKAFLGIDKASVDSGTISMKNRELIAVAVAHTTQALV